MFFHLSKIFWFFAQPLSLVAILLAVGFILAILHWRRMSLASLAGASLILVLAIWTSLGAILLHPLEDRFPRPVPAPTRVDGMIVLGGGLEGGVNLARGGYELNAGGDRLVEAAILARRYPDAQIVVTGGAGTLILEGEGDADTAPRLLTALGVERERLVLENRSRDTYENALFSKELVKPEPGETWLLVTSAFHMPRSVGLFRKAGFPVVPWPTDYRTGGHETFGLARENPTRSLELTTLAMREWLGLLAYWLTGRTEAILPGPQG